MKHITLAMLAALAIAAPASARVSHSYHHVSHSYGPHSGHHYMNVSGDSVHSPMHSRRRPAQATARCRDGSWSFSQHHSGTCSGHGGVASW